MKHDGDIFGAFMIGVWVGTIALMVFLYFADSSTNRYNTVIKECEKSLPRDQHCKVIAVPMEKKE